MKRKYISPEIEVQRIQLEEMMTTIDISNPEDTKGQGYDENESEDINGNQNP